MVNFGVADGSVLRLVAMESSVADVSVSHSVTSKSCVVYCSVLCFVVSESFVADHSVSHLLMTKYCIWLSQQLVTIQIPVVQKKLLQNYCFLNVFWGNVTGGLF